MCLQRHSHLNSIVCNDDALAAVITLGLARFPKPYFSAKLLSRERAAVAPMSDVIPSPYALCHAVADYCRNL